MTRRKYTPEEKSGLVLEALRGERTIHEIALTHNIHPNMLSKWKREAEKQMFTLFEDSSIKENKEKSMYIEERNELQAKIDQLTVQNEWMKNHLVSELSVSQRRRLVDRNHRELSISAQADLLDLNRSGIYYKSSQTEKEIL